MNLNFDKIEVVVAVLAAVWKIMPIRLIFSRHSEDILTFTFSNQLLGSYRRITILGFLAQNIFSSPVSNSFL